MSFLSALLFGISASLDAFLVGTALGLQKISLSVRHNLLISTITLVGTILSIGLGSLLLPYFPAWMGTYLGSLVLILFGLYYIGKWVIRQLRFPSEEELISAPAPTVLAECGFPDASRIFALGCALSMNNIGIGFSASITGLPVLPASVSTFLCSVGFLAVGNRLGRSPLMQRLGAFTDPVSGLLLILLGFCQLCA